MGSAERMLSMVEEVERWAMRMQKLSRSVVEVRGLPKLVEMAMDGRATEEEGTTGSRAIAGATVDE